MFTWIGIFNSDSGKESILKFVFERKGLSGIIFFEQEGCQQKQKVNKQVSWFQGIEHGIKNTLNQK
jgi:hypothetical protein